MPQTSSIFVRSIARFSRSRTILPGYRSFTSTQAQYKGSQNSTPGYEGRSGDDHALHRDRSDVQADSSHQGREDHEQGKGGQATSRKDEGNHNERAKKDHPEAPDTVIGMNDERGGKGH